MSGPRCSYCGKDWVSGCWDANEAAVCGNLDAQAIKSAKELVAAIARVERLRKGPSKAEIEKAERRELKRLEAKYRNAADAAVKD